MTLDRARERMASGDYAEAMAKASDADITLLEKLEVLGPLEEELERTATLFKEAGRLKIDVHGAGDIVKAARRSALTGDMNIAMDGLVEARKRVVLCIQADMATTIVENEMSLASAMRMGLDITEERDRLDSIVSKVRAGVFSSAREELRDLSLHLGPIMRTAVEARLGAVEARASSMKLPVEMGRAKELLAISRSSLAAGRYAEAFEDAREANEEIDRQIMVALEVQSAKANRLLEMTKLLNDESLTLKQKMVGIKHSRAEALEGIRTSMEVVQYASGILMDDITRALARTIRSINNAKKNGVVLTSADQAAEGATRSIEAGDLEKGYDLLRLADTELERSVALQTETYDQIVTLTKMLAEIRPLDDTSRVAQLLNETKTLFEKGMYDGARVSAKECYKEIERAAADTFAARKVQELKDMLGLLFQSEEDASEVLPLVKSAEEALSFGENRSALESADRASAMAVERLTRWINREIDDTRRVLKEVSGYSTDISGASNILDRSEAMLADKRFADAHRAVRFARGEVDQLVQLERTSISELERAKELLEFLSFIEVPVNQPIELLRQADVYALSGKYAITIEMARNAVHSAAQAAKERFEALLKKIDADIGAEELAGKELDALGDERARVLGSVEAQHFREAMLWLEIYSADLRAIETKRERASLLLASALEEQRRARELGIVLAHVDPILDMASADLREGDLTSSIDRALECMSEIGWTTSLHRSSAERLARLKGEVDQMDRTDFLGEELSALVREAGSKLSRGDIWGAETNIIELQVTLRRSTEMIIAWGVSSALNLAVLLYPLGLKDIGRSGAAGRILDLKVGEASTSAAKELRTDLQELHRTIVSGLRDSWEKVKAKAEGAKARGEKVTVTNKLLDQVTELVKLGRYSDALSALMNAEMSVGAEMDDLLRLKELSNRNDVLITTGTSFGLDMSAPMALFREASRAGNDIRTSMELAERAAVTADAIITPYVPKMNIVTKPLPERDRDGWIKMSVHIQNTGRLCGTEPDAEGERSAGD